jgi:hypothetical protein
MSSRKNLALFAGSNRIRFDDCEGAFERHEKSSNEFDQKV